MKCRGSALPPLLTLALALASLFALAPRARADEIRLKNGAKIVGTIVGYDDGVFKIETSYGYALIRKDSIAEIVPDKAPDTSGSAAASSPAPAAAPVPAPKPIAPAPAPAAETKKPAKPSASPPASEKPAPAAASEPPAKAPVAAVTSPAPAPAGAAPPPTLAPPPPAPAAPPPVVEEIRGNLYVNTTYSFEMYRPPDWELIENAQKDLPNAIAALGTSDETTLFIVGRDPAAAHDTIEAHAAAIERTLREVYDNYRPISSEHATVAGVPALESHFRGKADERDWSGTVVTFMRGEDVFTILAMTYADSDLIQIQENVIAKTIGSLKFDASAPNSTH